MAASNLNHVVLTGNLTKDPELKQTSGGTSVCELRVAVNSAVKKDGEWTSKPNYFQVNAWGRMGENCDKYLQQGAKVGIDGRLEWQMWESANPDDKGKSRTNSRVVIVANQVEFLQTKGKKADADSESDSKDDEIPF